MHRQNLVAVFAVAVMQFSIATAEDFPNSIVDFVKPNGFVSLSGDRTTGNYLLTILTQDEYSLAQDVRLLDEQALLLKYPDVAKEFARLHAKGEQERHAPRSDGTRLGRTIVSVAATSGELYKVIHVGTNYLLFETAEVKPTRLVLNAVAIKSIKWNLNLRYNSSNKVLRGNETEPSDEPKTR